MITLILSYVNQFPDFMTIIGYVLVALECLIVLTKFLQIIVDPASKFGKFLSKLLKGLHFLKEEVKKQKDDTEESDD